MSTPYAYAGVDRRVMSKRISWGAIFAGVVIAIAVQFLLTLLGAGIGMSTVDPQGESASPAAFGIGAGIWWAVSSLIALFVGGWAAGHLAGNPFRKDGALHGFLTWSVATLVMLYMISTAVGTVVGGAFSMVKQTVSSAAPAAVNQAADKMNTSSMSFESIKQEAMQLAQKAGVGGGATQGDPQFEAALDKVMKGEASQQERQTVMNYLQQTGMDRQQAETWVQDRQEAFQRTEQTGGVAGRTGDVKQKAAQAADTASKSSLIGFFAMLLGAIAAIWGGAAGTPRRVIIGD